MKRTFCHASSLILLALAACDDARTRDTGSAITETGFLRACEANADCADGLSCVCGVCTRGCDNGCGAGACFTAGEGPACVEPPSVCLTACTADGDCEGALRCVEGACVGAPEGDAGVDVGDADVPEPDAAALDAAAIDAAALDAAALDAAAPDAAMPDAVVPDAAVPDAGPPLLCEDPLDREIDDLAAGLAVALALRDDLPAGAAADIAEIQATADAIRAGVRSVDCLDDARAAVDALVASLHAIRRALDAAGHDDACRLGSELGYVDAALASDDLRGALDRLWQSTARISAIVDGLPEGNVSILYPPGDADPLREGVAVDLTTKLSAGLSDGGVPDGDWLVEVGTDCEDWTADAPSRVPAVNGDAEVAVALVPGASAACTLTVTATLSANRTIRNSARWTLALGEGLDAPPLLYTIVDRPLEVARWILDRRNGNGYVVIANWAPAARSYEIRAHVVPDDDRVGGWYPPAGQPSVGRQLVDATDVSAHAFTLGAVDTRAGAGATVYFDLFGLDGEPVEPGPNTRVSQRFVVRGVELECGTCEPERCDDGDPCTADACDAGGQCAHTLDPECTTVPERCPYAPAADLYHLAGATNLVLQDRTTDLRIRGGDPEALAALDGALADLRQVAGGLANEALQSCLPEENVLQRMATLHDAQRALFLAADALDGQLWAPAGCSTGAVLAPLAAAIDAEDATAAIGVQWALVTPTGAGVEAMTRGDAGLSFPGLGGLPPLVAGEPVEIEIALTDRYLPDCAGCVNHTTLVRARPTCAGWTVAPARRPALTSSGDVRRLAFTVTPDAAAETCELVFTATLRENAGRVPDEVRLPLQIGRAPGEAVLVGLEGYAGDGPHDLRADQGGAWSLDLLVANHDDAARTYLVDVSVTGDVPGWGIERGEPFWRYIVEAPPLAELPPPQADGVRLEVRLMGPPGVDVTDTGVELTAQVVAVDDVPVDRPARVIPLVVSAPLACE